MTMRVIKVLLKGLLIIPLMLSLSCQRQNLRSESDDAAPDITRAGRVVIFPFPKDKENSDIFYSLAAQELWPDKVVPQEDVAMALQGLTAGARGMALSKDQVIALAEKLGADAVVTAYIDAENVLRVKAIDVVTRDEWTRERKIAAGEGLRVFVDDVKADFKNSRDTGFKKPVKRKTIVPAKRKPVLPATGKAGKFPSSGEVSVSTFPATGDLKPIPSQTKILPLGVEPLGETSIHDFDYRNIGSKRAE